jgi:hypothetical protein
MGSDGPSVRRRRAGRRGTWWPGVRALLLLASLVSLAPPAAQALTVVPAQVPGGGEVAAVTLTAVTPSVIGSDDVLTLRGELTNISDAPLADPLPALRWSSDPLQTLDDVDLVSTNPLFRYGLVDYRFADPLPTLDPGEQVDFTVEVDVALLPVRSGVHVFGVDVLASLPDGLRVFVASARTTVPVDVEVDDELPVALMWPLAAAPSLLPDGRLVDDALAGELADTGRLDTLVDVAAETPVTWVIDPDLVRTAAAMAGGYETLAGAEGTGADDAQQFLADLAAAITPRSDVRAVPAADPDVGGAQASRMEGAAIWASVADGLADPALDTVVGRPVPAVSLLVDRPVTNQMLGAYLRGGVGTTVLARAATTAGTAATSTDGPPAVTRLDRPQGRDVEAVVASAPPEAVGTTGAIAARQWMLSSTAVLAAVDPPADGWVVAPPVRWQPDAATAEALLDTWQDTDWIRPAPVSALPRADEPVALVQSGEPEPLPEGTRVSLDTLVADVERLQPLFAEPPLAPDELPRTTARAISFAWQEPSTTAEQGQAYVDALVSAVTAAEDQLRLVVSPSITLSSRSGRFPVSMVNDSTVDVVVGVRFTSQNTSRLRVEDVEPTLLTAGEKRTITATAIATANGRLQVQAQLVTTQREPVGAPVTMLVDVTNVGALGWAVIGAGGALLAVALVRTRLRAQRDRDAA